MTHKKQLLTLALALCFASAAQSELRVNNFGQNGTVKSTSTAEQMKIDSVNNINCNDVIDHVEQTAQNESLNRQNVVQQVMGTMDFSPMLNCQKVVGNIASQISKSGGSFGFAAGVISQIGGSAACNYGPINRGLRNYNGYARTATGIYEGGQSVYQGAQTGNVNKTVSGATKVGSKTGVISSGTASTVNNTANAGTQVYEGYQSKNTSKTAGGSKTILNTGSHYLTGGN